MWTELIQTGFIAIAQSGLPGFYSLESGFWSPVVVWEPDGEYLSEIRTSLDFGALLYGRIMLNNGHFGTFSSQFYMFFALFNITK